MDSDGQTDKDEKELTAILEKCELDCIILQDVEKKLTSNLEKNIKNSTAYTMSVLMNCIAECESDLMVDPYLNSLRAPPGG